MVRQLSPGVTIAGTALLAGAAGKVYHEKKADYEKAYREKKVYYEKAGLSHPFGQMAVLWYAKG